ncbi:MAG: amidohydrolase family protein [Leptospiraceae bacterium]|nr:amidohydrolase family protein [Leptospiraceae bacterium]
MEWQISNATLVEAGAVRKTAGLHISDGTIIDELEAGEELADLLNVNLHGMPVFPGWINGHDSLLASFHVFKGQQHPYRNWLAWDNELKSSDLFKRRMLLDTRDLYLLGAYRNLLSGVTLAVDHIPHFVRDPFVSELPISILPDFGISHSICSYSLDWGEGPRREYERAAGNDLPYITHIAEGFDSESIHSLRQLDAQGGLGEYTVLVHGLALSEHDLDRIAEAQASVVWCPASNQYIYGRTTPIAAMLQRGINVCLGSDAAMYGSESLLTDIRAACAFLNEQNVTESVTDTVLAMITENARRAFRLSENRHSLRAGSIADLTVVRPPESPVDTDTILNQIGWKDIYLVVRNGIPVFGDVELEKLFTTMGVSVERIFVEGTERIVATGLRGLLERVNDALGENAGFSFLPVNP